MPSLALYATILCSILLPNWLLLVFGIPLLMVLANMSLIPPILSLADADIQVYDVILLMVGLRVLASTLIRRQRIHIYHAQLAVGLFLIVLLGSTLIAYYRFGEQVFIGELIAFLRLVAQVSVFFLFVYSIETLDQLNISSKLVEYLGYAIAATVYFNIIMSSAGIRLGGVQPTREITRYFGPIGDQVGFILLFFIYRDLRVHRLLGAFFLGGALVATGTVGSFIALVVGLIALGTDIRKDILQIGKRIFPYLTTFLALVGVLILLDLGSMRTRFTEGFLSTFTGMQRLLTANLAIQVFLDNPLTGVGYTGFRYISINYGAEETFSDRLPGFSPNYIATTGNQYLQVATDGGIFALAVFFWMVIVFLRTLRSGIQYTASGLDDLVRAGHIWLLSLLLGTQTAAWLLPGSLISYLLWLILGSALAASRFSAQLEGQGQAGRRGPMGKKVSQHRTPSWSVPLKGKTPEGFLVLSAPFQSGEPYP